MGKRSTRRRRDIEGSQIAHAARAEELVTAFHLPDEAFQFLLRPRLIDDDAARDVRQPFDRGVVHPHLGIDQDNLRQGTRVGRRNIEDEALDQHRLAASRRACNQGMRLVLLRAAESRTEIEIQNLSIELAQADHE